MITAILVIMLMLGCSGGSSPVEPGDSDNSNDGAVLSPPSDLEPGRLLLLAYDVTVDFETQEISLAPIRTAKIHFDIKSLLTNPWFCPTKNCLKLQFLEFDPAQGYFTVKATLVNPSTLVAHDVRGIVYDNDTHNHQILNPDDYTKLWAPPGYDSVYPFRAFARTDPDRAIHALASFSEIYEFQFDPLPAKWQFPYAIDCSWPDNCEEPYIIYDQDQIGDMYQTHGCTKLMVKASHHSGPAHLGEVEIDASSLNMDIMEMEYNLDEDYYEVMLINEDNYVESGVHDILISASSPGTDIKLYDYFYIDVKPSGDLENVTGIIHDINTAEGIPLALMTTSDGDNLYIKEADYCGFFGTNEVPHGSRVFSFSRPGYHTDHVLSTVSDEPIVFDIYLNENPSEQPPMPVIEVEEPEINLIDGIATISGFMHNMDCFDNQVGVYVHQGYEYLMDIDNFDGSFSQAVILTYGHNEIVLRATNATGTVLSDKIEIDYFPEWNFRVTLTWDSETDMDLHMWEPDLIEHCYWLGDDFSAHLELDHDIITPGFGPENITPLYPSEDMPEGVYPIAVDYYSGYVPVTCYITLRLNVGTPDEEMIQFEHVLTESDYMDYYPVTETTASWWRACDLVIEPGGFVTWQEADTSLVLYE